MRRLLCAALAVAAVVATRLAGVPTATSPPEPTATLTPEPNTLLPRSLYYLAHDANGMGQIYRLVYRLGRDGATITQITSEQDGINGFDISSTDGTIAYIVQNNLAAVDANGGNRHVLVNALSEIQGFPVWSPDGKTIVYNSDGINFYSIENGDSSVILPNDASRKYTVQSFPPDGSKLILSINHDIAVYDNASGGLFLPDQSGGFGNLNDVSWASDSKHIYIFGSFAGGISYGISNPGLWRYNVEDGSGGALLIDGKDCVEAPIQDFAGNLTYLYARSEPVCEAPPLSLVRSGSDGITNRTMLRPETFRVLDALWTPDSSALLIVQGNEMNTIMNLILVPIDPSLPVVTILSDAGRIGYMLRWGP